MRYAVQLKEGVTKNPITIWEYNGKYYASGLGKLYTQEGLPLSLILDQCVIKGWIPTIETLIIEIAADGAGVERAETLLEDAVSDMAVSIPKEWGRVSGWRKRFFEALDTVQDG